MKKPTLKYIFTLLLIAAVFAFAACSDLLSSKENQPVNTDGYIVTGKVYLGSENGAAPAFTANNSSGKNSRSATYSFDQESFSGLYFNVKAKYSGEENASEFSRVEFDENNNSWKYFLLLPKAGDWEIWAERAGDTMNTVVWKSEPITITVSDKFESLTKSLIMKPVANNDSSEIGRVELRFKDETEKQKIWTVLVKYPDQAEPGKYIYETVSLKDSEGLVSDEYGETFISLPSGSYEVQILCYDVYHDKTKDVKELYSATETFNVLSGFVTDTWYGDDNRYKTDDDGLTYYAITDEMLSKYSDPGDLTCPIVLWSDTDEKSAENGTFKSGGTSENPGMQIFGKINGGESISSPMLENMYSFCIGGGYVWGLTKEYNDENEAWDYCLNGFKASYSKYIPDDSQVYPLDYPNISKALTYYNNAIYFAYNDFDEAVASTETVTGWHFARLDLTDGSLTSTAALASDSYLAPQNYEISSGLAFNDSYMFYIVCELDSDGEAQKFIVYKSGYSLTGGEEENEFTVSLSGESFATWSIDLEYSSVFPTYFDYFSYESFPTKYFRLGDLQLVHNSALNHDLLYALVYVTGITKYYESKTEGEETSYVIIGGRSGGVMAFDMELKPVQIMGEYIYGCYSVNPGDEDSPLYVYNRNDYAYEPAASLEDNTVIIQPPENLENEYFYGPRRFIAIKPDELVIADDGARIEEDDIYCKSRVVTLNLDNYSLSAVDVNVTYSSVFTGSGGTFISE